MQRSMPPRKSETCRYENRNQISIGDRVTIRDLENTIGPNGTTYEVQWFHNGDRKEATLFEHELIK